MTPQNKSRVFVFGVSIAILAAVISGLTFMFRGTEGFWSKPITELSVIELVAILFFAAILAK